MSDDELDQLLQYSKDQDHDTEKGLDIGNKEIHPHLTLKPTISPRFA